MTIFRIRNYIRQRGNSILEMILFLPIAGLFAIIAFDIIMSMNDKATLTDALRSGLGDYKAFPEDIFISNSFNENFLNWSAEKIFSNIQNSKQRLVLDNAIQLNIYALNVEIDKESGKQGNAEIITSREFGALQTTALDASTKINSFKANSISPFAEKNKASGKYKENSTVIFAELTMASNSVSAQLRVLLTQERPIQKYEHFIML